MNILFINSSDSWGGTEKWVMMTAVELQRRGHSVHYAGRSSVMLEKARLFNIPSTRVPLRNEGDLFSLLQLREIIRRQKTEIVISTKVRDYWLGGLSAKSADVKCVVRLGILRTLKSRLKHRFIYGRLADGIIVNTAAIAEGLAASPFINPEKIRVIYNGVPAPDSLQEKFPPAAPFRFFFAGSLTERKNVRLLIEIFHKFCAEIPEADCRLQLAGDGPQRSELQQLAASLQMEKQVEFLGHRDDVPQLLQQAHMFVFLSANEGFPNAAFEAMARGVPVLLADMAGYREIVTHGETGWLVDARHENEVLSAMKKLFFEEELQQKLRRQAFQMVKKQFSPENMAARVEQFLEEVLRGKIV